MAPATETPEREGELADLRELAAALVDLHKALLEAQRAAHEEAAGPIAGSAQLLHLLTHDPAFTWLRALSALMVDLDGLVDESPAPSREEAGALRAELEELLSPAAPGDFWQRCMPALQKPEVAMAYARVRTVLARLPRPVATDAAAALHAQHRWAVARRKRGRI